MTHLTIHMTVYLTYLTKMLRQDTNTTTSLAIILAERLMEILIYGVAEADVALPNK
jgi:hypothetical protein